MGGSSDRQMMPMNSSPLKGPEALSDGRKRSCTIIAGVSPLGHYFVAHDVANGLPDDNREEVARREGPVPVEAWANGREEVVLSKPVVPEVVQASLLGSDLWWSNRRIGRLSLQCPAGNLLGVDEIKVDGVDALG